MAQSKKGKISTVHETSEKVKVKDSTAEIDDLFSVLSTKKSSVSIEKEIKYNTKKEAKKNKLVTGKNDEVTLSDLEGLNEDVSEIDESDAEDNLDKSKLVNGTAYDPKKDDKFPVASAAPASLADDSDFFDSRGLRRKTRALTEDGYPIFTPKELKIGLGGGTNLCPFDCNCCF